MFYANLINKNAIITQHPGNSRNFLKSRKISQVRQNFHAIGKTANVMFYIIGQYLVAAFKIAVCLRVIARREYMPDSE